MDDKINRLKDRLSLIAFCSSTPGNRLNGLENAMRWIEKSTWATEALEIIKTIEHDEKELIFKSLEEDLLEISQLPRKVELTEDTRLNHCLVWYKQIQIGRQAYQNFVKYLEAV